MPAIRDEVNVANITTNAFITASSIISEFSSAISVSASDTIRTEVASSPYAGAALSSAVSSGANIGYSLTSYVTDAAVSVTATGANNWTATPSIAVAPGPTITYTGSLHDNGTVTFQKAQQQRSRLVLAEY